MMPSLPKKPFTSDACIPVDEYDVSSNMPSAKKNTATTDHSQRIGKLLPYISSMQNRRVNEKEYLMNSGKSKASILMI